MVPDVSIGNLLLQDLIAYVEEYSGVSAGQVGVQAGGHDDGYTEQRQ